MSECFAYTCYEFRPGLGESAMDAAMRRLNAVGARGWELVAVSAVGDSLPNACCVAFFKKRFASEAEYQRAASAQPTGTWL